MTCTVRGLTWVGSSFGLSFMLEDGVDPNSISSSGASVEKSNIPDPVGKGPGGWSILWNRSDSQYCGTEVTVA